MPHLQQAVVQQHSQLERLARPRAPQQCTAGAVRRRRHEAELVRVWVKRLEDHLQAAGRPVVQQRCRALLPRQPRPEHQPRHEPDLAAAAAAGRRGRRKCDLDVEERSRDRGEGERLPGANHKRRGRARRVGQRRRRIAAAAV
eukprot:285505-Chlamydomonas_euryale.AAC.1